MSTTSDTASPAISQAASVGDGAKHTPTPWFVSGVRFRMNGGEWQSINRYDETKKQDENIACVGYDSRTGLGLSDAHFIVKAVNSHETMTKRIARLEADLLECQEYFHDRMDVVDGDYGEPRPNREMQLHSMIDESLNGSF